MIKPNILVVEDDPDIQQLVSYNLIKAGMNVTCADRGEDAIAALNHEQVDGIVLDLMLPGLDGLETCRRIREQEQTRNIPVVILTAKGEDDDVVTGLDSGADDYVTKPFSPKVLVARVRAILHRAGLAPSGADDRFVCGDLMLDVRSRQVTVAGRDLDLTATEFDLLRVMMEHPGWVFTREQLLEGVTGYSFVGDSRTIDVHVANLRKKVEEDPSNPRHIRTVRGVGYKFQS